MPGDAEPLSAASGSTGLDRVASAQQPVRLPTCRGPDYFDADAGLSGGRNRSLGGARTVLAVPMLKEDELIGAIAIYRQEVRPFTDKQIELVQNFAAQAVIAIENTRLLNELRQRTDDLPRRWSSRPRPREVLQVISSSPGELEPVFQAMLENATRICEAKFGMLFRYDGERISTRSRCTARRRHYAECIGDASR